MRLGMLRSAATKSERRENALVLYRRAFHLNGEMKNPGKRLELDISVAPGQEIATVKVRFPEIRTATDRPVDLIRFQVGAGDTFEVTNLRCEDAALRLVAKVESDYVIIAVVDPPDGITSDVEFNFEAWEAVSPLTGTSPYLHSTLTMGISACGELAKLPMLVTLRTPADATPRSTQGNYSLAYPSRLMGGERLTNLYYHNARRARIHYRFGSNVRLADPWLNMGKAAISAIFVFFITALAATVEPQDRILALIATFAAVGSVMWDLVHQITVFSVYDVNKTRIYLYLLVAQLCVALSLASALIGLTIAPNSLRISQYVSLGSAVILSLAAMTGLILHSKGWWHGFMCDHAGCDRVFRVRRDRPECHYTGRVYCRQHSRSICGSCVHGVDLLQNTLDTHALLGSKDTPCGVPGRAAKAPVA